MEQNIALLVMDMQSSILSMLPEQHRQTQTGNTAKAIAHARAAGIPVIFVVVGFRQSMIEISPNNKSFSGARERFASIPMEEFLKVDPTVAPLENEPIAIKRRVSGFAGSDLEVLLRAQGIQHLVLSGIATSGVVLSTLREAADKDYKITVLSDCCADGDEEVHRVLTTKVFPRQADVMTQEEWSKL